MKKKLLFIILIGLMISVGFSQNFKNSIVKQIALEVNSSNKYAKSNIVCGNILFQEENKRINDYISAHPEYVKSARRLQKPMTYNLGDTKNWWVSLENDQGGTSDVEMPSTCLAVGEYCYIFVSDKSWNDGKVSQENIDRIVNTFDNTTPNFPNEGIYEVDVRTFGNPPDFDGDDKIVIFLFDIEDDFETTGTATIGFFHPKDQYNDGDPAIGNLRSNETDIFYIDTYPAFDEDLFGVDIVLSILAHEFQHMIHYAHDPNEMLFINEGLSEIAMFICGYGLRRNSAYSQNTNRYLFGWENDDTIPDYSRAAFWTLYLYEQYPNTSIIKDLVNNTHGNYANIDNTLRGIDQTRGFFSVFEDWLIANYVNGKSNDAKYSYQYTPLSKSAPAATHIGNKGEGSGTLNPLSAEYITFSGGDDLTITFTGDVIYKVRALKIGSLEIENVEKNTQYTPSGYGTTYPEVTFLLYNDSPGSSQNYSYIATGSDVSVNMELAYEDGVPDGFLGWNTGDSMAVIFPGFPGAKLDSIKTFYAGTGKIDMEISKYDGNNFLRGENIYSSNRNVLNSDNWNKVNLVSSNIDASDDFVVSYLVGADPNNPTVRVSPESDTGEYHSRTYTNNNGTTQWWIFHNGDTPQLYWNFLIRAYLSIGGGTVAIDQNGIVSIPDDFSLGENYPNPFNPTTTFNFATPKDGMVNFTVHDLLGRVIYSEHRNLLAGNYSFTWNGQNNLDQQVVSGVYFLKMEADGFAQTRKMLMMK